MKARKLFAINLRHNLRHFRNIIDGIDPRKTLQNQVANTEVIIRTFA